MIPLKHLLETFLFALAILFSGVFLGSAFLCSCRKAVRGFSRLARKDVLLSVLLGAMVIVGVLTGFSKTNGTNRAYAPMHVARRLLVEDSDVARSGSEASIQGGVDILTNVYVRARMVYSACGEWDADVEDRFSSVRPGGLQNELEPAEWSAFSNLCAVVSNSYGTILQDWGSYSTNELVRFTVLNAVAYSGENVYTNFFDRFMANCELSQGVAALPDITYLCSPFGTPLEEYTALHYDDEIVSNLLVRAAVFAENHGGTNLLVGCRQRISGAAKQYYLENR